MSAYGLFVYVETGGKKLVEFDEQQRIYSLRELDRKQDIVLALRRALATIEERQNEQCG